MKEMVVSTLQYFPDEISSKVSKKCWFISSFEDGWAFVLSGGDVKNNEYVIFLSDELLKEDVGQIRFTIAHEIGHVILGHRNAINKRQSKSEIRKQEKQADEFVKKFFTVI